jgi:hypothetical protein
VAWANTSFDRCKNITITNVGTSTLTNFPAYVNLSYDSDMLSNYQDLRFYDSACNYGGYLMNYEIENYTAANAHVWVRIPSLPTAGTTYTIYLTRTAMQVLSFPIWLPLAIPTNNCQD